jgi:hypothetical protein
MHVINWKDCEDVKIDKFPYRGKQYDVKGISVRWLSKHGDDGTGYPEYGLRFLPPNPLAKFPFTIISTIRPCISSAVSSNAINTMRKPTRR